ncbi:MAG: hypothetical protein AABY68_11675 [Pseudomonadota bacterium]
MMNARLLNRVKEHLDTLMAEARPLPSDRQHEDFSYRLNEDAFILQHHTLAGETSVLTAHPLLKVIHTDDPTGWLLYALDSEGHWQPHAEMVFTPELSEAINAARRLLGLSEHPAPMSLAI